MCQKVITDVNGTGNFELLYHNQDSLRFLRWVFDTFILIQMIIYSMNKL